MIWAKLILNSMALVLAYAPLHFDATDPSLRTLRNAGYEIQGRDPCDGTGLCCALLPANKELDVYYITFPAVQWKPRHYELIKRFANLRQIRSKRPVTESEYQMLKKIANDGTLVIVSVERD